MTTAKPDTSDPRSCILQVGVSAGRLCGVANTHMMPQDATTTDGAAETGSISSTVQVLAMSDLLVDLWRTSVSLNLNLIVAIRGKLELNAKKYPVEHCKVRDSRNCLWCYSKSQKILNCLLARLDTRYSRIQYDKANGYRIQYDTIGYSQIQSDKGINDK